MFKNIIKAISSVWKISKLYLVVKFFMAGITAGFPLYMSYLLKLVINEAVYNKDMAAALKIIGSIACISIIYALGNNLLQIWILKIDNQIELSLNKQIIYKLSKVEYSFFDDTKLYNNVENATQEIKNFTTVIDGVFALLSAIISLCIIVPYVFYVNVWLALFIVVVNVPLAVLQSKLKKINVKITKEARYYKRCAAGTRNMLVQKYYAGEIRIFSLFHWLFERYKTYYTNGFKSEQTKAHIKTKYETIMQFLSIIATSLTQLILIKDVIKGLVTIGDFTLYTNYLSKFNDNVYKIVDKLTALYEKELFLKNLFDFLDIDDLEMEENLLLPEQGLHSIEFRNVTFKYKNSSKNILDNVSFNIKKGETLAIVGLNGAGKTTLINLLLRFYKPDNGEILLDGININNYSIKEYYRSISVVFQNPMLYPWSLHENICFDKKNERISASDYFWLEQIVEKFPNGMDTTILPYFDSKGIEPSRGEVQRIALARALNKEANILLLDEPSASMDAEIEYSVFNDLKNLCKNKTAIIISHRLSMVTTAANIILLNDGHIVEKGCHSELIKRNGEYARLFHMQAEKYNENKE